MPKLRLTDRFIASAHPGTYWDTATPAFGIRVGKNRKTFILVKNHGHRLSLGRYPELSLSDARLKALQLAHTKSFKRSHTLKHALDEYIELRILPSHHRAARALRPDILVS